MLKRTLRLCFLLSLFVLLVAPVHAQEKPPGLMTPAEFHELDWQTRVRHFEVLRQMDPQKVQQQEEYDPFFYRLDLDASDVGNEVVYGAASTYAVSLVDNFNVVLLDFSDNMDVDSVTSGGESLSYSHANDYLEVYLNQSYNLGEEFEVTVYYYGHPGPGYFGEVFWWDTHNSFPIIQTLSEPWGAREWWACKDDPSDKADSADMNYTVRDDMIAASNGLLVEVIDNGNGTKTYKWQERYPITTYLIFLAATNYEVIDDWYYPLSGDSMPIAHYVFPEHYNNALEDLNITPDAISFYANRYMEYPFTEEKYGHAIFEWGGAMEHQTCTSYGSGLIRGNHAYDFILVHELSHQWWGDMVTCGTWADIWLNEGFASYSEALWAENIGGWSNYHDYMINSLRVSDPSGPIYDPDPLFSGNTVYHKGAWVLHMLRHIMGDDPFFEGLTDYGTRYMHKSPVTMEFIEVIEDHYPSGDLWWYFEPWLWGVNRPWHEYSYMCEDVGGGEYEVFLHVDQKQTHPAPFFTMPLDFLIEGAAAETTFVGFNDTLVSDWRVIFPEEPTGVTLDPQDWVLTMKREGDYSTNIVTTSLPDGDPGLYYSEMIEVRGGNPLSWEVSEGELPDGLALNDSTGELSGTPTGDERAFFTVEVTDDEQNTDTQKYMLIIGDPTGVEDGLAGGLPEEFRLLQNYPNPFNAATTINYELPRASHVCLEVYNLLGQRMKTLVDRREEAGYHSVNWSGSEVSSGIYFVRLQAGDRSLSRKMLLVK
jgi:aminopeptidase N